MHHKPDQKICQTIKHVRAGKTGDKFIMMIQYAQISIGTASLILKENQRIQTLRTKMDSTIT